MWAIFQFLLLTQSQCTRVISAVRFQFSSHPLEEDHPGARSPSSSCSPTWWVGILPHCLWTSVSSWSRHAPREGRLSARAAGRGAARRPLRGGPWCFYIFWVHRGALQAGNTQSFLQFLSRWGNTLWQQRWHIYDIKCQSFLSGNSRAFPVKSRESGGRQ